MNSIYVTMLTMLQIMSVDPKVLVRDLVKFVPAVAYHFSLDLPATFSQPCTKTFSQLCTLSKMLFASSLLEYFSTPS